MCIPTCTGNTQHVQPDLMAAAVNKFELPIWAACICICWCMLVHQPRGHCICMRAAKLLRMAVTHTAHCLADDELLIGIQKHKIPRDLDGRSLVHLQVSDGCSMSLTISVPCSTHSTVLHAQLPACTLLICRLIQHAFGRSLWMDERELQPTHCIDAHIMISG